MKQYIVIALTLLFTVLSLNANAQTRLSKVNKQKHFAVKKPHNMDPAKAIEMRTKRICNELMLSEETAAKFSPLYKSYLEEMQKAFQIGRKSKEELTKDKSQQPMQLTDKEIDEMFKARFERTAKINTIQENYYSKFRKVLSAKQVSRIFHNNSHEGVFHSIVGGHQPQKPHFGKKFGNRNFPMRPDAPKPATKEENKKAA